MALRSLILHNFWLKLFSVALATMIWLAIHFGIQGEAALTQPITSHLVSREYMRVPVSVITQPGDARLFKITPSEVVVTAIGENAILSNVSEDNLKVYVDLRDFHATKPTSQEAHCDAPRNINVTGINPPVVNVEQVSP